MKYYLVIRDDKQKENKDILQFNSIQEARRERDVLKKNASGEVVLVFARDIKSMLNTFTEYRPKNWKDYIKKYTKNAAMTLHDPHLEKQLKVEEVECHLKSRGIPGSYHAPAESPEVEVTHATLSIPELAEADAEKLPTNFDVQKSYAYESDGGDVIDLVLTFHVDVKSKKILPNKKVEVEYTDTLKDWDYY